MAKKTNNRSRGKLQSIPKMKIIFLAVCLMAAKVSASKCPDLSVVQNFDVANYTGTWYQQASLSTFLWQYGGSCVKAEYTLNSDTGKVDVVNSEKIFFNLISLSIKGYAELANASSTEGKLKVTLKTLFGEPTADYWILATDYDNFAIVYSCYKLFTSTQEAGWILTRKQIPDDATKQLIKDAMTEIEQNGGPKYSKFKSTSQKNC